MEKAEKTTLVEMSQHVLKAKERMFFLVGYWGREQGRNRELYLSAPLSSLLPLLFSLSLLSSLFYVWIHHFLFFWGVVFLDIRYLHKLTHVPTFPPTRVLFLSLSLVHTLSSSTYFSLFLPLFRWSTHRCLTPTKTWLVNFSAGTSAWIASSRTTRTSWKRRWPVHRSSWGYDQKSQSYWQYPTQCVSGYWLSRIVSFSFPFPPVLAYKSLDPTGGEEMKRKSHKMKTMWWYGHTGSSQSAAWCVKLVIWHHCLSLYKLASRDITKQCHCLECPQ